MFNPEFKKILSEEEISSNFEPEIESTFPISIEEVFEEDSFQKFEKEKRKQKFEKDENKSREKSAKIEENEIKFERYYEKKKLGSLPTVEEQLDSEKLQIYDGIVYENVRNDEIFDESLNDEMSAELRYLVGVFVNFNQNSDFFEEKAKKRDEMKEEIEIVLQGKSPMIKYLVNCLVSPHNKNTFEEIKERFFVLYKLKKWMQRKEIEHYGANFAEIPTENGSYKKREKVVEDCVDWMNNLGLIEKRQSLKIKEKLEKLDYWDRQERERNPEPGDLYTRFFVESLYEVGVRTPQEAQNFCELYQIFHSMGRKWVGGHQPSQENKERILAMSKRPQLMSLPNWALKTLLEAPAFTITQNRQYELNSKNGNGKDKLVEIGGIGDHSRLFDCARAWKHNGNLPKSVAERVGKLALHKRVLAGLVWENIIKETFAKGEIKALSQQNIDLSQVENPSFKIESDYSNINSPRTLSELRENSYTYDAMSVFGKYDGIEIEPVEGRGNYLGNLKPEYAFASTISREDLINNFWIEFNKQSKTQSPEKIFKKANKFPDFIKERTEKIDISNVERKLLTALATDSIKSNSNSLPYEFAQERGFKTSDDYLNDLKFRMMHSFKTEVWLSILREEHNFFDQNIATFRDKDFLLNEKTSYTQISKNLKDDELIRFSFNLVNFFGNQTKQWLDTMKLAGRNFHDSTYFIPVNKPFSQNKELVNFILKNATRNLIEIEMVVNRWHEIPEDWKKMDFKELVQNLRENAYPGAQSKDFAQESSYWGISNYDYLKSEKRFLNSLQIPSPFDLNKRYEAGKLTGRFIARSDPRGVYLGQHTNCCQHPDGMGSDCAWYGQTSSNSGFFAVENSRGEIIAQSWLWISDDEGLCFDSVETKGFGENKPFVKEIYESVISDLSKSFYAVTVSQAKGLKLSITDKKLPHIDLKTPKDYGSGYTDSESQKTIAYNPTLKNQEIKNSIYAVETVTDLGLEGFNQSQIQKILATIYPQGWDFLPQGDTGFVLKKKDEIIGFVVIDSENQKINEVAVLPENKYAAIHLFEKILAFCKRQGGEWKADTKEASTSYKLLNKLQEKGVIIICEQTINGEKINVTFKVNPEFDGEIKSVLNQNSKLAEV